MSEPTFKVHKWNSSRPVQCVTKEDAYLEDSWRVVEDDGFGDGRLVHK